MRETFFHHRTGDNMTTGLAVGTHCPLLVHIHPPRLRVKTTHVIGTPDGKPNELIGGPGDPEWEDLDHLFCPECGVKFHAVQKGEDVEKIVLSSLDPTFTFTPRVITPEPPRIDDETGDLLFNVDWESITRPTETEACQGCGNPLCKPLYPKLAYEKHLTSFLLEDNRTIFRYLLRPYHFCAECLTVFENKPHNWIITASEHLQVLNAYNSLAQHYGLEPLPETATPEEILMHLREP